MTISKKVRQYKKGNNTRFPKSSSSKSKLRAERGEKYVFQTGKNGEKLADIRASIDLLLIDAYQTLLPIAQICIFICGQQSVPSPSYSHYVKRWLAWYCFPCVTPLKAEFISVLNADAEAGLLLSISPRRLTPPLFQHHPWGRSWELTHS